MGKVQDAQQNLAVLRRESAELANEITLKRSELNSLQKEIKSHHDSFKMQEAAIEEERKKLQTSKRQHDVELQNYRNEIESYKLQIRSLKNDSKEATKELAKVNSWVMQANEEYSVLLKHSLVLKSSIEEQEKILREIELLKVAKAALKDEVLRLKADLNEIQNSANQSLYLTQEAKKKEEEEYRRIRAEREKEQILLYNTHEHRVQIEHDISIYVSRAQLVYKQAFPELEMKL